MVFCFEPKPKKALSKAYLKKPVDRADLELFRDELLRLYGQRNPAESEEHIKIQMTDFLKKTLYGPRFLINTKDRVDLTIAEAGSTKVLFEVKHPDNKSEMMSAEKPNAKALHQLLLYFLRERVLGKNLELKHLVITNVDDWFVFDARDFEALATKDKELIRKFQEFEAGGLLFSQTGDFYSQIAKPWFESHPASLSCVLFSLSDLARSLAENPEDLGPLLPIYQFLSPGHLLREAFQNDSNTLDKNFYGELLYWMGLEEAREGSKIVIRRPAKPVAGSLTELILDRLNLDSRGVPPPERWDVALELSLLWMNRLIFLKLLESQLLTYHNQERYYRFLGPNDLQDFGDLYNLFFGVLAIRREDRNPQYFHRWSRVPYMNSRLFELSPRETAVFSINQLDNNVALTPTARTVLKNPDGTRDRHPRKTLDYLLAFLDAYNFSSEGTVEIQESGKTLINASVLGLIFEKINGYKEGSFFTPGHITQYMARQSVHSAILTKFRQVKGWECADLTALHNHIRADGIAEANQIINSLKIVDPAVGSGHFLVSVLNELIAAKSALDILTDADGKRLRDYRVVVENDELFVVDGEGEFVTYRHPFGLGDRQRVWETVFREKKTLIENCLFGVDINPNSVQICKLRLWIELLKHSYYTPGSGLQDLETLPNLDIKIREGNSLVSRYALDVSLNKIGSREPGLMTEFLGLVREYQDTLDKTAKNDIERHIQEIKAKIRADLEESRPLKRQGEVVKDKLDALSQEDLFGLTEAEKKARDKVRKPLEYKLAKLQEQLGEEERNPIYRNSFEWRFEFPEVLDPASGDFVGFDVVIGNPPYGVIPTERSYFERNFDWSDGVLDSYYHFWERMAELQIHASVGSLIIPNTWMQNLQSANFRKSTLSKIRITTIDLFTKKVFEHAVVDTCIVSWRNEACPIPHFVEIFQDQSHLFRVDAGVWEPDTGNPFNPLLGTRAISIQNKLKRMPTIGANAAIVQGCKPFQVGKGIPPQTRETVDTKPFVANTKIDSRFRPLLRGSLIGRYTILWNENYFIALGDWLAEPRYSANYDHEKIVIRQTGDSLVATVDREKFVVRDNLYAIIPKDSNISLELLCGLINSRLMNWAYQNLINDERGEGLAQVKRAHVASLPLPSKLFSAHSDPHVTLRSLPPEATHIESLVTDILSAKKINPAADTRILEAQIDRLAYTLYDLTEEEIHVVEGNT